MNQKILEKTLNLVFKTEENVEVAQKILLEYRDRERAGSPFRDTEREEFSERIGIDVTQYDYVLGVLRSAGLVAKVRRHFYINTHLIHSLLEELLTFLGAKREVPKKERDEWQAQVREWGLK